MYFGYAIVLTTPTITVLYTSISRSAVWNLHLHTRLGDITSDIQFHAHVELYRGNSTYGIVWTIKWWEIHVWNIIPVITRVELSE